MGTSIFYVNETGRLEVLKLDAALSRESAKAVEVTRYPVEDGSVISDHAIRVPDSFRLEGMITGRQVDPEVETPPENASRERAQAIGAERRETGRTRATSARDALEGILERKRAVSIESGGRTFPDLIMVGLNFPENGQGPLANATYFVAAFEKIETVRSETAPIPVSTGKPAKTKGGKKPTEKAPEAVRRKTSAAVKVVDAVKGAF